MWWILAPVILVYMTWVGFSIRSDLRRQRVQVDLILNKDRAPNDGDGEYDWRPWARKDTWQGRPDGWRHR